ncbi:3-oxoacyl-(acyl-carrier-protein) reductase [Sphingobium chlorophenolicum L-1]|uniref:3-oxoacyl-(Acyl-carrier-protein) reductase n=1 Tax=Sphingobium chlorophenolicum L-1 TaxID=690566 RepID=F6F357_SPHCR|nr:SDR family oxidoreductase [Sphingobium chlorophenolicum]AEG50869.1 3-oxoacyl-(acyl-carrier-protein) reductase [Sphingobium chlorophenolicum L-1]
MAILDDRVCIITGGAGSIGLATARLFLSEGAKVVLVDLHEDALASAAAELASANVITQAADVGDAAQTRAYVDAAVAKWGRIDVLFCNAGNSGPIGGIEDYPEDAMDAVYRVHVRGSFLGAKHALPHMDKGGSIIVMSSVAGLGGSPGVYAYCTAKHAQIGLMRSLAKEVAGRGIRVNSLHPGPIDNSFQTAIEDAFSPLIGGGDATAMLNSMIPMGRHGQPAEIAQSALFLASSMSAFTTGSILVADGGFTA